MGFFTWLASGFRTIQGFFQSVGAWIAGIPVVGGSLSGFFYNIAAWFGWMAGILGNLGSWWDWLIGSWVPWAQSQLLLVLQQVGSFVIPFLQVISTAELEAWISRSFRLFAWVDWAGSWLSWLSAWANWVQEQLARILDWEAILANIERAFGLTGFISWARDWFVWLWSWSLWAQDQIESALDPAAVWSRARSRIDAVLESEAEWFLSRAARVLELLW